MDFDKYGKVKCRKIEQMLPKLMKMVEEEMESMVNGEEKRIVGMRKFWRCGIYNSRFMAI